VKILEKDRISDMADVERVAREIHILKLIRHPNIDLTLRDYRNIEATLSDYGICKWWGAL
jgi:serine/threonine protein kinase